MMKKMKVMRPAGIAPASFAPEPNPPLADGVSSSRRPRRLTFGFG